MKLAPRARGRDGFVARGVLYGVLWGITVSVGEALSLPLGVYGSSVAQFVAITVIGASWCVTGIVLACATLRLEPTFDTPWKLGLAVLMLALLTTLLNELEWLAVRLLYPHLESHRQLASGMPSLANFWYVLWMTLFHGGIFIVACVLLMRAQRSQRLLGSAQLARRRTEALLDEAEFETLRGRVDPVFLLRAMAAVQARYARDADAADRMLDQLVAFLRRAMPVVRSGSSTLKTEVDLARDYAALGAAIDSGSTLWRVQADGPLPDMAFPPLLLLPLMDHFNGSRDTLPHVPRDARLCIAGGANCVEIVIESPATADAAERAVALPYRLQVALRTAFGSAWSVQPAADAARSGVALRLRIARNATPAVRSPAAAVPAVIPAMP